MKYLTTAVIAGMLSLAFSQAEDKLVLKDEDQKVSYSIGVNIGKTLQQQAPNLDPELVAAGLKAALSDAPLALSEQEMMQTLMAFQNKLRSEQTQRNEVVAEKNEKEGEAFLAANKEKEGVKTLPSGLQYKILKEGNGPVPTSKDSVTTHYRGTLIDGTEFDSSYKRGQPASFPVTGVIAGWTEALQLMPVGSKWQLFVPSDLAYGESGRGNQIGPNATLVFEVELLAIENQ